MGGLGAVWREVSASQVCRGPWGVKEKRVRQEWLSGRLLGAERVQLKDKWHGGAEGLGKGLGQRKGALEDPGGGKREPIHVVEDGEGK